MVQPLAPKWRMAKRDGQPVYVVWHDDGNTDVVFAPFHQKVVALRKFLRDASPPELEISLLALGELGDPVFDVTKINSAIVLGTASVHLAIGLSRNCSLKCVYCHSDAASGFPTADRSALDRIIADAFARAVERNARELNVSFCTGGEPTYNWSTFKHVIAQIRDGEKRTSVKTQIQMTTNGFYGNAKRKFIVENISSVTLSLDGIERIQNAQRPTRSGHGSFQKVLETAKFFYESSFPFGLRSTVTRQGCAALAEFVQFVDVNIGKVAIGFEPVVPIGRGAVGVLDQQKEFSCTLSAFAEGFWEAYLEGRKRGLAVSTSSVNLKKIVQRMCGALAIPSITLTSTGKITACHRDDVGKYAYGAYNARGELVFDDLQIARIRALGEAPEACDGCFCRYSCGGDCPDLRLNGLNRCDQTRQLTYLTLLNAIEETSRMVPSLETGPFREYWRDPC